MWQLKGLGSCGRGEHRMFYFPDLTNNAAGAKLPKLTK